MFIACRFIYNYYHLQVDVTSYKKILIPVNLGAHWCLVVVDFDRLEFQYYDSMAGDNIGCLKQIRYVLNV